MVGPTPTVELAIFPVGSRDAVAVIDGDWLTVEWTFSDPGVEVKGDFDETMTVLDKGWASVGVVLETCTPMDEVTAFDKEDDGFREETVALGLGDTVLFDAKMAENQNWRPTTRSG